MKVDLDLRKDLFSNIYLAGGSTLFKGLVPPPFIFFFLLLFFSLLKKRVLAESCFLFFFCFFVIVENFTGYGERLLSEVKELLPREAKDSKIKIFAPPERKYSAWIGGSILANLTSFKKVWVTAEEYKEDPDIIYRKAI